MGTTGIWQILALVVVTSAASGVLDVVDDVF